MAQNLTAFTQNSDGTFTITGPAVTNYTANVKFKGCRVATITGVATSASGVMQLDISGTSYYIPFYAAAQLTGE